MAQIPGSVRVAGFIAPTDSNDTYPVTDSIYGKGGYREVADITARDAITTARRREGLMVYVIASGLVYVLVGGIDNINWQPFSSGTSNAITSSPSGDWKQVTSLEYNHITGELRVSYNNI